MKTIDWIFALFVAVVIYIVVRLLTVWGTIEVHKTNYLQHPAEDDKQGL